MPTDPTTLTLTAAASWHHLEVSCRLPEGTTREDAQAIAALFPKSVKLYGSTLSGQVNAAGERYSSGFLRFSADLRASGNHGERNETGIKRYKALRTHAERLGITLEWSTPYRNALSEADAEVLLSGTDAEAAALAAREYEAFQAVLRGEA